MINVSNLCIFEGRMARDAQVSQIQMGTNQQGQPNMVDKALFTLAVSRALTSQQRQKVKNGDQSIKTVDFIPCSLIGAQVAVLKQYFPQGKPIKVMGHYTEYQTTDQQTGQKKYGHMFEIDNIGFALTDNNGNNGSGNNGGNNNQQNNYQNNNNYQQNNNANNNYQQNNQQQPNFSMFDEADMPF